MDPTIARPRARVAGLKRSRPKDDPAVVEAERDLHAKRLELAVRRELAKRPPLTEAQKAAIAALFAADGGAI